MNLAFIVGTGRCGSSLIHEILARHEDIGFISNIDDNLSRLNLKGRWNNQLFRTPLGRLTRKGSLLKFAPSEAYKLIARQISPIYESSDRDLAAGDVTPWLERHFVSFFEARQRAQGRPLFLHKYTGWSRMGFFGQLFPEARFIHIVRDGRAVANSWLQMRWWGGYRGPENWLWGGLPQPYDTEWSENNRSYTRLAGIGWKVLMDSYERASREVSPDRYLEVRYEDFLVDPQKTIESILAFLNWRGHQPSAGTSTNNRFTGREVMRSSTICRRRSSQSWKRVSVTSWSNTAMSPAPSALRSCDERRHNITNGRLVVPGTNGWVGYTLHSHGTSR